MATAKKTRPPKGTVRVKMLPKDPRVARNEGLWPVEVDIEAPTAGDGPSSARVCVVDYNADLDTLFAPAELLKDGTGYKGIATIGANEESLRDFTFHQVNVWAVIEQTLGWLEDEQALARPIPWASGLGRLLVIPHAGYNENAFYDRSTGALHFFYFEGHTGDPVYTCMSRDIITHELGHAVLDGLKPGYNEVSSAQTAGFHEYFGDAIAMMASLRTREIALKLTQGLPDKLAPKNIVSAIASEFGAAVHGLADHDYLRGAWTVRTMKQMSGQFEEHDWSEVLTGVYYELLQFLYAKNLKDVVSDVAREKKIAIRQVQRNQQHCMRAVMRAAGQTANVMLRALDYCPPVDLRYNEYARALLRADEVAYPLDLSGIRAALQKSFKKRGLLPAPDVPGFRSRVTYALRGMGDIDAITATLGDAYRFVDRFRDLFSVPHDANIKIASVYATRKSTAGGFRPPRERIIEFTWTQDVELKGKQFGALAGTHVDLHCGGTLVFDSNGNFLHYAVVPANDKRRKELLEYMAYQVRQGSIGITDGLQGIGAPSAANYKIAGAVTDGRLKLTRNAAMRHFSSAHHRH
jgi:hypothetical protein